jgi:hypothetical protein
MNKYRTYVEITCPDCKEKRTVRKDGLKAISGRCRKCAKLYDWEKPEYAKKCSESHIGYKMPEEQRQKISKGNKGISHKNTWYRGDKHFNWQGGITPDIRKARNSDEYKVWRTNCFIRDNYKCVVSGRNGKGLCVHHINNFSNNPEDRFNIDNGITLASEIHKMFHRQYGIINNNKEQLIEFTQNYQIDTMGSRQIGAK